MKSNLLVFAVFFISCVEEYTIPKEGTLTMTSDIVIQGRILSGDNSIVYITRTQPLNSKEENESVPSAQVTIIGQNGYESELAEFDIENDYYYVDTKDLPNNTLYALQIKVENEVYQSEFQPILVTPEIDEVSYKERNDGISIHVSTNDDDNASRCYMWTFEEDWEFHSLVNFTGINGIPVYDKQIYSDEIIDGKNPYLYCWKHAESANVYIYDTSSLQTNVAKDVELFRISTDDIRISYIYSILVKQISLSKKAFNYYDLIKKYSEESGGLFSPIPSEIKGNITCVSNPEKKVHGYVLASTMSTKRIFIYEENFELIHSQYEPECIWKAPTLSNSHQYEWDQLIKQGAIAITTNGSYSKYKNPDFLESILYSRECVDCRAEEGATKKRPDFWPNNHE